MESHEVDNEKELKYKLKEYFLENIRIIKIKNKLNKNKNRSKRKKLKKIISL